MNLDFLKIFDNPLSKYLTKGFLEYIGHKFDSILKLNTVLGLLCLNSKNFLYIMLYQLTKFQYLTFFTSQYIKQFVFLNSYLDT